MIDMHKQNTVPLETYLKSTIQFVDKSFVRVFNFLKYVRYSCKGQWRHVAVHHQQNTKK